MTTHVRCAVHVICLLLLTPLTLQKSIGSPRAITQWELEFVGLHFHQSLEGFPCSADGTVSSGLPVSLVVGYTLPNSHVGKVGLTVERPEVSCPDGAVRLRSSGSSSRMTISVVKDKACSEEAHLQLHINIHTKQGSKPVAYFHKEVYSLHAGREWSWALLPDAKETTLLALKWRVSCGEQDGPNPGILENSIRRKRQATNEDPTENTLPDSGNESKHSSFPTSKSPGIPDASVSAQTSVTGQGEGLATLPEDSETFSSGEPPDSFVTGISEIFGLTKKPSSKLASSSTHPSTSSRQFTTLLQTLFGPSADVTTLIDRSSSFSTKPVSLDDTYTSLSSTHRSSPSPTQHYPRSDPDFTERRATSAINAPAAGNGNSQTPDLAGSQAESDFDNTTKPDTDAIENSTVSFLSATMAADNPTEGVDITARASVTNPESQDGVSSRKPVTDMGSSEPTRRSQSSLLTTTTSTGSSATHGDPISTTTTANKPEQEATSDTIDDQTKASSKASATPSRTTKASNRTTTTTATPTVSSKAPKPFTATTNSEKPTRTNKQPTSPKTTTSPTPTRTSKPPTSTSTPARTSKPPTATTTITTTTTTTTSTTVMKTPKPPTTTTRTSTKTTSTTTTTTTPKPDVIFTQSKTKPTPTYPETSNEAYMGKTGDGSSAGRIDETSGPKKDSEKTNEATLWPVVMGLVIGIPTIIVLAIAITVVQKKHIGVPHRHLSSPGYFERRPPQVPFVEQKSSDVEKTLTDTEV